MSFHVKNLGLIDEAEVKLDGTNVVTILISYIWEQKGGATA